jgi:hypothetical protein
MAKNVDKMAVNLAGNMYEKKEMKKGIKKKVRFGVFFCWLQAQRD